MMDENFLFHRKRALRLLELMEEHDKAWSLDVFSSANVLRSYTIDQLVRLGIAWVWMGIEGRDSQYSKLAGIDTFALVRELQSHGIRVLGSTIIGLENHTPENIDEAIEYAVRHDTDFHQFMLYTPVPGTPLHAELTAKGLMKDESEYHPSDIHGQLILNYRHPALNDQQTAELMVRAFDRDFAGQRAEHGADRPHHAGRLAAVQEPPGRPRPPPLRLGGPRAGHVVLGRGRGGQALLPPRAGDARQDDGAPAGAARRVRLEVAARARPSAAAGCCGKIRKEEKRLAAGFSYEPPTFYERNAAVDGPAGSAALPLCDAAGCSAAGRAGCRPRPSRSGRGVGRGLTQRGRRIVGCHAHACVGMGVHVGCSRWFRGIQGGNDSRSMAIGLSSPVCHAGQLDHRHAPGVLRLPWPSRSPLSVAASLPCLPPKNRTYPTRDSTQSRWSSFSGPL